LTVEPIVDKDRVYYPIYEPTAANNKCGTSISILMAYYVKCGNSLLNVTFGKGVLFTL
tara:strand:+ start:979 stop:1152 length:174 start_codon:yes stop_codon:yes gene_type:complete